jgi:hypothetical protein
MSEGAPQINPATENACLRRATASLAHSSMRERPTDCSGGGYGARCAKIQGHCKNGSYA